MRPIVPRHIREACPHPKSISIRADLPDSYGGRQWCHACGVFFVERTEEEIVAWEQAHSELDEAEKPVSDWLDWPATEKTDREQIEKDGQMRLPE